MALSRGDDYPIHQTPEPVALAGTDRNFYDRYFFNGYAPEGKPFFAAAFGVYPHLDIADASFCVVRDGVQTNLHASRWLAMERMDLKVGPICIEVIEPLKRLRVRVNAPEHGLEADVVFAARAFPLEEPRFVRRIGPRTVMDYTRLTQNGHWSGWIGLDGRRIVVDHFAGTRDRSWGVRPVGARDAQSIVPPSQPQFFWIWAPANMEEGSFFFHSNEDGAGRPWNQRAAWAPDGAGQADLLEIEQTSFAAQWKSGTRHVRRAVVTLNDPRAAREVVYEPEWEFFMLGLGYGHQKWGHGLAHGELEIEREDLDLARIDPKLAQYLHVQALCKVIDRPRDGAERTGRGILEQLIIGPHAPSGFKDILDFAP